MFAVKLNWVQSLSRVWLLRSHGLGRSQDGRGIGRGDHFLPYKFIEGTIECWANFTKQLLIASGGHQAPRKATHCLRKEVGQNIKAIPWTVAHQASLSMEFSRQEYWSRWPFPPSGALPDPAIKPWSPALQADDSLLTELQGKWKLGQLYLKLIGNDDVDMVARLKG